MSIPSGAEVVDLADLLVVLRDHGVKEFASDGFRVVFAPPAERADVVPQIQVSAVPASTPEHSGTADALSAEKPKRDIFDILGDGAIPGAPTRDALPSDTDSGPGTQ